MDEDQLRLLKRVVTSGEAMLFTGAGFSSSALDRSGRAVPSTEEITREIWDLCFPEEPQDDSTLTDLFHHAARHAPDKLDRLLKDRLCVRPESLPDFYEPWLRLPWMRVWTLNVDDIEQAVAKRFGLPKRVRTVSALTTRFSSQALRTDALPVIHLNGSIDDGIEHVTFSTTQYGERLARSDPWYAQFIDDLVSHPFVIVGTRLEEAPFWRNLHASHGSDVDLHLEVCRAFIVSPRLTRARRELLQDLGIRWLPMSAEDFASEVLSEAADESQRPRHRSRPVLDSVSGDPR